MSKKEIPVEDKVNEEEIKQPSTEETVEDSTGSTDNKEEAPVEDVGEEKETADTEKKVVPDVDSLQKELSEMKDKYLRIFAEFDNYRKRTMKERQEIIKLAAKDSLGALLPAVDDFGRAITVGVENENAEEIPEGIILIYNKLFKALEQQGIKEMDSTGVDFDPELHEALTKIPAPSEDLKGKVIQTIEKGYYLNDKIIRYPKVVVGE
jgi:molecular chaperone GrpE